jgi:hypothetical protein
LCPIVPRRFPVEHDPGDGREESELAHGGRKPEERGLRKHRDTETR